MTKKMTYSIIGIVSAAVVACAGYGIYHHLTYSGEVTNVEYEFEEEQTKETQDVGASASISIPGYKEIVIDAGSTEAEVTLTNPEENEVYFEISFYLPDSDETIYKSKLIRPGQSIYTINLDKALEAGEYNLTINYATYAMDDNYTPRNGAQVNCKLVVE